MQKLIAAAMTAVLLIATTAFAATYYVDYETGADTNPGTSMEAPWQHSPGDTSATANPKAAKLLPGDVVKFKGGVIYRGSIDIVASGEKGQPIFFDGNASGDWGQGMAIIDGSTPLENLKPCAGPQEVFGNPNYKNIYWTTVPKGAKWNTLNLCQDLQALAWSQEPNPADPLLQENPANFFKITAHIPQSITNMQVKPVGMNTNSARPLIAMFDGSNLSAVIENFKGGAVEVTLEKPVTVVEFSVTPQPKYVNPRQVSFHVDGKEILRAELQHNPQKAVEQKFKLEAPVTFTRLLVKFESAWPLEEAPERTYGAVQKISGYDADGKNVLLAERKSFLRNDEVFTQSDANFYDNSFLALHAIPNIVYYKRITGYSPAEKTIDIEVLGHNQRPYEKGGAFSIVNNPRHIDVAGEYALMLEPDSDGSHKLFLWPPDGKPENLTRGKLGLGLSIRGSHITVDNFWIRKQGWTGSTGISARGPGTDLIIRNCKVSNLRGNGVGITTTQIDNVLVANCDISDNAGHTKGIVLRNASNIVTRGCTLRKNSSTALDYYTVTNGVVQDCLVIDNTGMHANGLTFYVGCKDILVERNIVRDGNAGLTVQDGENMIIRNNIIEAGRGSPAIGLWAGKPYNNIVITNNILRCHDVRPGHWTAAIYGGNDAAQGYAIVNNVIDGLSGNVFRKAELHHNIFTTHGPSLPPERLGNNLLIPILADIFVNAEAGDYRLKPGSPAIDAGIALTTINRHDFFGTPRPQGRAVDIGLHELIAADAAAQLQPELADPNTFKFTLDGYTISPPEPHVSVYKMKFPKRDDAETIILKGVDRTDEGGGKVNLRPTLGGYISGWDNADHWLEWTVDAPAAGAYELCIEHGSETPAKRRLILNGQPVKGLDDIVLPATGGWTTFEKIGLEHPLMLKAGKNIIRFINVQGSHNFKTLEFIPVIAE